MTTEVLKSGLLGYMHTMEVSLHLFSFSLPQAQTYFSQKYIQTQEQS